MDNFVARSRAGRGKRNTKTSKIFPGSPKQAGKKEKGFRGNAPKESPKATLRGKNFCPSVCPAKQDCGFLPAAAGGGQSKVGVGIFPKKGSDFIQKRQQN